MPLKVVGGDRKLWNRGQPSTCSVLLDAATAIIGRDPYGNAGKGLPALHAGGRPVCIVGRLLSSEGVVRAHPIVG